MLHIYTEYEHLSQVCSVAKHIKGAENTTMDNISYVHVIFNISHPWLKDDPAMLL